MERLWAKQRGNSLPQGVLKLSSECSERTYLGRGSKIFLTPDSQALVNGAGSGHNISWSPEGSLGGCRLWHWHSGKEQVRVLQLNSDPLNLWPKRLWNYPERSSETSLQLWLTQSNSSGGLRSCFERSTSSCWTVFSIGLLNQTLLMATSPLWTYCSMCCPYITKGRIM